MSRPTFLVLGGFLGSEWEDLWQRQQEWTTALMRRGNVIYLERAAAGNPGLGRALGRVRKMLTRPAAHAERVVHTPFPAPPEFVRWLQVPGSSVSSGRANAKRALAAAEERRLALGWEPFSLVHVGTPAEPWIELGRMADAPVWFDSAERFVHSAAYAGVAPALMRRQVAESTLVTTDTRLTRSDWTAVRKDIVVVEHGAKSWAAEPDFSTPRTTAYYVGSAHAALDVEFLSAVGGLLGHDIVLVGEYPDGLADANLALGGWSAGGDLPPRLSDGSAGLVPYRGGAWRQGVYPSKVYDYFLAGMPAISTPLPALDSVENAWQVDTPEAAADAVKRAEMLAPDARREIRAYALENTWEKRFEQVEAALAEKGVSLDG